MKRMLSLVLALLMLLSLAACGSNSDVVDDNNVADTPVADEPTADEPAADEPQTYLVGICQLVQHTALDAATQGFKDALTEALGDAVSFDEQNAAGDSATCVTICNQFISENVDLIMANATPALQAAAAATATIPILGTSITDYATALSMDSWNGTTGVNISGTSDLAPLEEQAAMIQELFPDAINIGILYCSAEANSAYQEGVVRAALEAMGYTVADFTFVDSNDVAAVAQSAAAASDVIYIPTDNTAASCTEVINNVCLTAGVPIVAGEEGICRGCGVATLSISYYDIGYVAGQMAVDILVNGADVSTMPVQFAPQVVKEYNATICEQLGITVPDDYVAIAE